MTKVKIGEWYWTFHKGECSRVEILCIWGSMVYFNLGDRTFHLDIEYVESEFHPTKRACLKDKIACLQKMLDECPEDE